MRVKLSSFILFFGFTSMWGQTILTITDPITGTFKVPAGVTSLNVECWGAGGAGGGVNAIVSVFGGGGGGGGAYGRIALGVTPATLLNYKVGAGGVGVNGSDGPNGEPTFFSTVSANGGNGGKNGNTANGNGGTGGISSGVGYFAGGSGSLGKSVVIIVPLLSSGGGGGSAGPGPSGTGSNGLNANTTSSTAGGAAVIGGGKGGDGMAVLGGGNGNNGANPGGGGAGALGLLASNFKGGNGGNGQIKVTYTCPTYSFTGISAANVCTATGTTSLVKLTSPTSLPIGDYEVTYNRSNPSATNLKANATVNTPGILEFTAVGLNLTGSSTIAVTNLKSESCSNNFSTANEVTIVVSSLSVGGSINTPSPICSGNTSGLLTLSGHNGAVLKWQYAISPFTNWIDILTATGNTYTSEILTQTTRFRAVVKNGACDAVNSAFATVTVNPLPEITTDGILTDICFEADAPQMATLQYSAANNIPLSYSISWNATANSAGLANQGNTLYSFSTGGGNINTIVIPGGVPPGIYLGTMTIFNASCSLNKAIQLTILPKPTAPTPGIIIQPTCAIPTGSVTLSELPSSVNWIIRQTGTLSNTYTNTGTSYTISNLAPGNYIFSVEYRGSCTSVPSTNVLINGLVTNTYTGVWSNGIPNINQNLVFASDYTTAGGGSGNISGCSCLVNPGVNVTVSQDDTLTVMNAVINNSGLLTFENNASLLQTTNAINTGNIVYKRISTPMKDFDYTYWSSPVSGQTLYNLSPDTFWDKYFSFSGTGWKIENPSTAMQPGIGYIIRVPRPFLWPNPADPTYTQPVEFIGIPNNGDIDGEVVTSGRSYLVGNPYPSALDADAFLYENTNNSTILDGIIYFWTHISDVKRVGGQYIYEANDYASYNGVGGVATLPAPSGGVAPSGNIAAGQSFFAFAKSSGQIQFNNSMRISGYNNQFFKPGKTAKKSSLEKHRLWLNMTNENGAFKQILIGYVESASNGLDSNFDGISLDGNPYLDFYSTISGDNLVIQGRALPFSDTDEISLGYRTSLIGDFSISIDHTDGLLTNKAIFIEDKFTNTIHDLSARSYKFSTVAGTFKDRFILKYNNYQLEVNDYENNDNNILVWKENKTIKISSINENIERVYIYDLSGKQVYKKYYVADKQFGTEQLTFANQIILIKIYLENDKIITRKVIF